MRVSSSPPSIIYADTMPIRAEIIAVGSELLTPWRLDTNSLFITRQLNLIGALVARKTVVGDRAEDLRASIARALEASDVVFLTGGLGPTTDDINREVVADLLDRPLRLDEQVLEKIRKRYERTGATMPPNNQRQALVPSGAQVLSNPNGTAPGLMIEESGKLIVLLPGPPRELEPMVVDQVIPAIKTRLGSENILYRQLKIAGETESRVDFLASPIYRSYADVETTILASTGIIDLFFYWRPLDAERHEAEGDRLLDELVAAVRGVLGDSVYADAEQTLESAVGDLLRRKGKTLAVAESCTGGLIMQMLTEVPGSSDYLLGGFVTYSNQAKVDWLGVKQEDLNLHGAVSPCVAEQMAEGVRARSKATVGLAATGIAGPGGGTAEKPVGLVYLGISDNKGTESRKLQLNGDRAVIRIRAARTALDWLRRRLM